MSSSGARAVNANLVTVPSPLRLLDPCTLVTIETWPDGTSVAILQAANLQAGGDTVGEALSNLREEILDFCLDVSNLLACGRRLAGPLAEQWAAVQTLVDVSGIGGGPRAALVLLRGDDPALGVRR